MDSSKVLPASVKRQLRYHYMRKGMHSIVREMACLIRETTTDSIPDTMDDVLTILTDELCARLGLPYSKKKNDERTYKDDRADGMEGQKVVKRNVMTDVCVTEAADGGDDWSPFIYNITRSFAEDITKLYKVHEPRPDFVPSLKEGDLERYACELRDISFCELYPTFDKARLLAYFGALYYLLVHVPSTERPDLAPTKLSFSHLRCIYNDCVKDIDNDYNVMVTIRLLLSSSSWTNESGASGAVFDMAMFFTKQHKEGRHNWTYDLSCLWAELLKQPGLKKRFIALCIQDPTFKKKFIAMMPCFVRSKYVVGCNNIPDIDGVSHLLAGRRCIETLYSVLFDEEDRGDNRIMGHMFDEYWGGGFDVDGQRIRFMSVEDGYRILSMDTLCSIFDGTSSSFMYVYIWKDNEKRQIDKKKFEGISADVHARPFGMYRLQERVYTESLKITGQTFGYGHPETVKSMIGLADFYKVQWKNKKAEPFYRNSLEIMTKALGEEHLDIVVLLGKLAESIKEQGRYNDAESFYRKSLTIHCKLLGEEHTSVATSMNNLAVLLVKQGKYDEADSLYQQSLAIRRKLLGEGHLDVASSLDNIAELLRIKGKYTESETLCRRTLEIRRKLLDEEHPDVATSLSNLAMYMEDHVMNDDEFASIYRESLRINRKFYGDAHPNIARDLDRLAESMCLQNEYDSGAVLYRQALAIRQRVLGEEHPDVAVSLYHLATLMKYEKNYDAAYSMYSQSLAIVYKVFGEEHIYVATLLDSVAMLLQAQKKYDEAEPLYHQSLAINRKILGEEHSSVALGLHSLAGLLMKKKKYEEAEPLYRQALAIRQNVFREGHPHIATSFNDLAVLLWRMGRSDEALRNGREALVIMTQTYGPDHAITQRFRKNWA